MKQFMRNVKKVLVPVFVTAMAGTITYPIAVRIARSKYLFKLRSFYAIHLAIAPFLAFAHVNIFFGVFTYLRITTMEGDYRDFLAANPHARLASQEDHSVTYDRLKRRILSKDYSLDVQRDIQLRARELEKVRKARRETIGRQLDEVAQVDYRMAYQVRSYLEGRI